MKTLKRLFITLLAFSIIQVANADAFSGQEMRNAIVAVQRYKDLSRPNTPLYRAFTALFDQSVRAKSQVFKDPRWPLLMAEKAYGSLGALQRGARTVGRAKIEKYEDSIDEMIESGSDDDRAWARLERAAYDAELAGNTAEANAIRQRQGDLECIISLNQAINRLANELALLR